MNISRQIIAYGSSKREEFQSAIARERNEKKELARTEEGISMP